MQVIVVGGGIAGISAALALADSPNVEKVVLLEARKHLGGRVSSVKDPVTGMELDNCQHACFRVYTRFLQLLGRVNAQSSVRLQQRTNLPFIQTNSGVSASLRDGRLSPPNHMLGSVLKFPFLSLKDKMAMKKAVKVLQKLTEAQRMDLDDIPFDEWLRNNGQTERAIERFWGFFVLAALNLPIEEASTSVCILLFKRGLFGSADAFDAGAFTNHLSAAIDEPIQRSLKDAGVEIWLNAKVNQLLWKDGECVGVQRGEEKMLADNVVLATPQHITAKLLNPKMPIKADNTETDHTTANKVDTATPLPSAVPFAALEVAERLNCLDYRAIIGIHALYEGIRIPENVFFYRILDEPLIQMIFNRNSELSAEVIVPNTQWLSVPISGADSFLKMTDEVLQAEFEKIIDKLWENNNEAELKRFFVVRSKLATFAPTPGSSKMRPSSGEVGSGITLAGDYTDHGWPSTMEGATRSGLLAAAHILEMNWNQDENWPNWPTPPKRGDERWGIWDCK